MSADKKPKLQRNFMGLDGLIWQIGRVEDRDSDPFKLGRCKVRFLGIHTDNKEEIPTEDLPWAYPLQSIGMGSGRNCVGLREGDWVLGFFRDGILYQEPIIIGILPGAPDRHADPDVGFNDPRPDSWLSGHRVPRDPLSWPEQHDDGSGTRFDEISPKSRYPQCEHADGKLNYIERNEPQSSNRFARAEEIGDTIVQSKKDNVKIGQTDIPTADHASSGVGSDTTSPGIYWTETETPYGARYPYNTAYWSEGGHLLEVDNTPGSERLHMYHRSSTFFEIHPNGSTVFKCANTEQHIVLADRLTHIENNDITTVDKAFKLLVNKDKGPNNCDITVDQGGNCNLTVKGGNLNIFIQNGDINAKVCGSVGVDISESLYITTGKDIKIQSGQSWYETSIGNRTNVAVGNRTDMTMGKSTSTVIGTASNTIMGTSGKDIYGEAFENYHSTLKTTVAGAESRINTDNFSQHIAQNMNVNVGTLETMGTGGNAMFSCENELTIAPARRLNISTILMDVATTMHWIKALIYGHYETSGIHFFGSVLHKSLVVLSVEETCMSGVISKCFHDHAHGGMPVPGPIPDIPERPFAPQVLKTMFPGY